MRSYLRALTALAAAGCLCFAPVFAAPKVGVLLKGRSAFWNSMEKGALDAGTKAGIEVVVKAATTETDVAVQIQLLNAMATQGYDAIVLVPANKEALAAPAAAAAAKGIKIVVMESPLGGEAGKVFVGTDHKAAGEAAGEILVSLTNETDEVSFLGHAQSNSATTLREKGAMAKFREARSKNVVHADIYASVEMGGEVAKAKMLLERYPATKVIFASGSGGTLAMLKVLEEQKLAGAIKLVGFGFNLNPDIEAAIVAGKMHGWIAWQPRELGRKGVETALALVKGEAVPAVVNTDFVVVTAATVKAAPVQALASQ